jgi:hypothetical protein
MLPAQPARRGGRRLPLAKTFGVRSSFNEGGRSLIRRYLRGFRLLVSIVRTDPNLVSLRTENAKLLEQREILKKSLGILSEVPPRGMPESNR